MAKEEHVNILNQGVETWNKWRLENPDIQPDLQQVDFRGVNFDAANLTMAKMQGVNLGGASLINANLSNCDLSDASVDAADLIHASLQGANLTRGSFGGVNFHVANLSGAVLREGAFSHAFFRDAALAGADFSHSTMRFCTFVECDLSKVKGLEFVKHDGPSSIGVDTIYRSKSHIPLQFLRGAGLPDNFIEYMRSLAGSTCEYHSCFISYSSKNQDFADRLYADLQNKGVRCWFAPENLKIGDKLRPSFDEAILLHDKLMVLLSEHSVNSIWVENEVETAFEKERRQGRIVLFPIRLDDAVLETDQAWAAAIRRARHIGDFRDWKTHDSYKKSFDRLLRDLKAEEGVV